ncbi:MAG: peptidase M4 [Proteobacteria bacterium]|nr:peptidase M4 [Pseudomonadota bacterium]
MKLPKPRIRSLKAYALDPSAGNYIGNIMNIEVAWDDDLKPGPCGSKIAVIDYDGAKQRYYPPVDLNDYRVLARGGLDPSESNPQFHQQMVYAVAMETIERFEQALGRSIHWHRADRFRGGGPDEADTWKKGDDIWILNLFPHAMVQANAFYSSEAKGILFGYFAANKNNQGRNLPGQCVFTCLSHDIIAHEVTHAVIDGIRAFFTEPTNPDVLAFHEAFADLSALFSHFSHPEVLLDTIQKTGGRLYQFELKPDMAAPLSGGAADSKRDRDSDAVLAGEVRKRNPLIDLAQQFGEATGINRGLRSALDHPANPHDINTRVNDVHFRGSILVSAVFDAYFTIYVQRTSDLFRIYRAGGGNPNADELPGPLARSVAEAASRTAAEFFRICARAVDYCPPVDLTFGDYLRALITVVADLMPRDDEGFCDALMQAFRVRGIFPEGASYFSRDALCWPHLPRPPDPDALPPVPGLVFADPNGSTLEQSKINGDVLRQYADANAARLGFDGDRGLPEHAKPYSPSFHTVFRTGADGRLRIDMVVELVQTKLVPFDPDLPELGTFPFRGGVTLIISSPKVKFGNASEPHVRFAIRKPLTGESGKQREARQREYYAARGLGNGKTDDAKHFQADFGLLHMGISS